jgi:hypothetical protein
VAPLPLKPVCFPLYMAALCLYAAAMCLGSLQEEAGMTASAMTSAAL